MTPSEFLELLWGKHPPGLIQLWQLNVHRSYYLKSAQGADYYTADKVDWYTGVALAATDYGRARRARADQAAAIAGLWLDVDVNGGPEHKTGAAPERRHADELCHAIAEPTIIINSGYGLQAWWLFPKPWQFADAYEQQQAAVAAAQWQQLHRSAATFGVDHAHDLARLLRLPGTINGKGGLEVPVTVWWDGGPRHERDELLACAAKAGDVQLAIAPLDPETGGAMADLRMTGTPEPPLAKLDALLYNDSDFAATWKRRRADAAGWSQSQYDMALAARAVRADWTDQEIANLIAYHRLSCDPGDEKWRRVDYLQRTIAKARAGSSRDQAAERAAARAFGAAA